MTGKRELIDYNVPLPAKLESAEDIDFTVKAFEGALNAYLFSMGSKLTAEVTARK